MRTIDDIFAEWNSKQRRMGCVSASNWFCKRRPDFHPIRLNRYTEDGDIFQHVVATNGVINVDLSPYNDKPRL